MPFTKGEIVSFSFQMPDGTGWVPHSGVILSCDDVYRHDKCYVCAMMSSNGANDRFSFHLLDSDLENPSNKDKSQVRCHLITYCIESDLQTSRPHNKLKKQAFERLIAQINDIVFDV